MRLREPLQGFKLSQGHFLLHVALLVTSMIVIDIRSNESDYNSHLTSSPFLLHYMSVIDKDITLLLKLMRSTHAIVIIFDIIKFLL